MDFRPGSIDDWDWSSTAPAEGDVTSAVPPPREPEPPPPSEPAPRRREPDYSQFVEENRPGFDRLPAVYREGAKNIYKRKAPETQFNPGSLDDYDWGESAPAVSGEPAYDPSDDWAITRGFKVASDQGTQAITAIADMQRIQTLQTPEEQVAEMLKIGRETADPSDPKLAIHGFTDVDSFGEGMSYIGESMGQMLGSMWAAATTGGAAGAAGGAAIGGVAGATAGGIGAVPGALAGGVAGFTKGTLAAFVGMGVGGTYRELLQDKGVQEGLENGTIAPGDIYKWALGAGAVVGALDTLPVANRWMEVTGGKKMAIDAVKQTVKKAALKGAARGFLEEGSTEAMQGAISELSQAIVGGDWDTANRLISVLDQGLAGGIGGAGPGSIGGIIENSRLPAAPDTANPVVPAGTPSPLPDPNAGSSGPNTGTGPIPRPPAGSGGRPRRDHGKTPAGAPVTVTQAGETDPAIAEALGFTEEAPEGEFARPQIVPRGRVRKPAVPETPVDVDVSAALTPAAEAAPTGQPPVVTAPAAPAQPRAPRGRKAPQVETVTEEAPQVMPAAEAAPPVIEEEEEGGVLPWQQEFGDDPHQALRKMRPDDPRYPEVVEWANAKDKATLDQFPPAPAEAAPEPAAPAAPEAAPTDDVQVTQQIIETLQSMGIPTKGSLSAALNSIGRRLGAPNLSKASPADVLAFLRENGVSVPGPQQRESVVEEPVVEEVPPAPSGAEQARIDAELLAIQRAEDAVSPWPKRQRKPKVEEEPTPVAEVAEPEEKPYKGLRKLQAFAEALKPTKHKLETGRYERERQLQGKTEQRGVIKPVPSKTRQRLEKKPLPTKEVVRFDATTINNAKDKLTSLVGEPKQYRYLWSRLHPDLQTAIGNSWQPENRLERPAPPQKPVKEREEAKEAKPEPVKEKRAPRAAIALPEAPATEAPKPKAERVARTVRLTPSILASFRGTREAALQRLVGAVLRHKKALKKAGTITGATFEGETVTAEREPAPELTVEGKTYTSTEAFNAARKKARSEKSRRAFSDAYSSRTYSALQRWEQTEPESKTEQFPEGRLVLQVGGKEQRLSPEETLDKYVVDISTTEERLEPVRLLPKQDASTRLAKHFRYGSKEPVKLSSVGFSEAQIEQLERAGFAEDGSMDQREFQRWRTSRKGLLAPETEFRPRQFEGLREVREAKPTYTPASAVPETERIVSKTEKATEAVRTAMRRAKARAEAIAEEEEQKEEAKKVRQAKTPTEKTEEAVKRRLMEPKPSGKTREVPVEPIPRPTEAIAEGRSGPAKRETERLERQFEKIPIMTPPVIEHEPTAERLAKEAVAFVEAGGKAKGIADAINAAFDRAMKAAEAYVKDLQSRAEKAAIAAAQEIAEAKEKFKGTEYQAVERLGQFKGKRGTAIAEESSVTTFRSAKAAYFANEIDETAGVKPKPDDELGAILWEMGELKAKVAEADKLGRAANRSSIRLWNAQFNLKQQDRIALAKKLDAIEVKQAAYWDEQAAKLRVKYHEWLSKLVEEDKLTADEAFDIRNSFVDQETMVKRKRRTRITDPAIKRVLRALPPPPDFTAEEFAEINRAGQPANWPKRLRWSPATVFNRRVREWAEGFIKAVDKAVREANKEIRNPKARAVLPHRPNRFNNSPEENMVQFLRGRLGKLKSSEEQKTDNYYQLGQTVADAWWAASLLHPEATIKGVKVSKRRAKISEHEHYLDLINRERELYDTMFDASGTGSTLRSAREMEWVADYAEAQQERAELEGKTVEEMPAVEAGHKFSKGLLRQAVETSTANTAIAEQLRKLFESPTSFEGIVAQHGGPLETMPASEAMDRFVSVPSGSFRASISAALRRLVGDVPVHFISDAAMREARGRAAGAYYNAADHKIYMHEAMRDHPDMLADAVIHEMAHAATVYALQNNIRGARDIFTSILSKVKAQATITDAATAHYLSGVEELIAGFSELSKFQKMLKEMPVPLRDRAALRALARGRPLANMWDYIMAAVENAIGVFTPAGYRRSYFDEIFELFPDVAMSSAEQQADAELRGVRVPDENAIFDHPFDIANVKPIYDRLAKGTRSFKGRRFFTKHIAPMEYLKRDITERFFNGDYNNPIAKFIDTAILKHTRSVEDEMREGLEQDNRLRRWASVDPMTRRETLRKAIVDVIEASLDRVDPRKTLADNKAIWDDALHPTKRPRKAPTARHEAATYRREAYDRHRANWEAIPDDLKALLSDRADYMNEQMKKFDHDMIDFDLEMLENKEINPITLPPGMTRAEAAEQIYKNDLSDALQTALGANAETLAKAAGRLADRGGMYWPVSRTGPWYISGRRKVPLPRAEHGYVELDEATLKERDSYNFVFTDIRDARTYLEDMGTAGEERLLNLKYRYINPITGDHVNKVDHGRINGRDWEAEPRYYVEVQHHFMAMGETVAELEALKEAMESGTDAKEYEWISDPLAMGVNHTPDRAMIPSQLASFHRNIDSMKGKTDTEKATLKSMATNVFVRTQQGNRLTKKMLHRRGVAGYETKQLDHLLATLNANNEMMSRHSVNRRRMAAIEKARADAKAFILAAAGRGGVGDPEALAKVPEHLRHLLTTEYGKGGRAAQLSQDWEVIEERYRSLLNPREVRFIPERWGNAVQSILVQTYLATPMYNVVNAMGFWLQSFPRIAGEIGLSTAFRYSNKADAYLSGMGNKYAGFSEAVQEGKDFVTGFLPKHALSKYSRGFREQRNIFEESMQKMQAAHPGDPNIPHLLAAAEEARLRNHVGQAGLDQINLNTDLMAPGSMQKVFRGIEQSQRVFRAVQEGIELDTRLKPMFTRLLYYLDQGMDPSQAIQKSVNEMANDQTGYSKENWPAWMNAPVIRRVVMFKKFPIQQTLNFYRAARQAMAGGEQAKVGAAQLFYMAAALSLVGGTMGLPPWEMIRLLMYLANLIGLPVPGNWTVAKTKMEQGLGDIVGERAAEAAMYGLPRLIGIDLSSRLALDGTLFFQQPKELTNDGIVAAFGYAVGGAPLSTGLAMATSLQPLIDEGNVPKFISQAPVPRFIKDIAKAYDTHVNGPTTKSGLQTAEAPGILSSLLAATGLRTREQARPFEQGSAAQQLVKKEATAAKSKVVRRILTEGFTKENYKRLQDYNAAQTDPKLRIKIKDISAARKRRAKQEREMQKMNLEAM